MKKISLPSVTFLILSLIGLIFLHQKVAAQEVFVGSLINDNKTLSSISFTGLKPGHYYIVELTGRWGERDYLEGTDDKQLHLASSSGVVKIGSICENGEGDRDNCGEEFHSGDYNMRVLEFNGTPTSLRIDDQWDQIGAVVTAYSFNVDEDGNVGDVVESPGGAVIGDPDLTRDPNPNAREAANTFLGFGLGTAGGIAFLLMVFGAYRLIFAAGNPESIQQGREVITAAIAGLLVIVFAVFILRFLGYTILNIGGL
ncbi:MAG: hypothetical protein WD187_03740 [Candidatus Woykebacteria bacterium]